MLDQNLDYGKLQWYALYTYPNREKAAARETEKLRIETFLPLKTEDRQWHDRVKRVQVPLFRNYVFVRTLEKQKIHIFNIKHVINFVSLAGRPCVIKDQEIELMKHLISGGHSYDVSSDLTQGNLVRVIQGPFEGWEGVYNRQTGNGRLLVHLSGIAQNISIKVPANWIEAEEVSS